jgi:hypothetical protein
MRRVSPAKVAAAETRSVRRRSSWSTSTGDGRRTRDTRYYFFCSAISCATFEFVPTDSTKTI